MEKSIRKAVRSFLIRDGKILVIRYKQNNEGYYDIPGGKIEQGETSDEASIREFREETGMSIIKQHSIGKTIIEFPDRIFDFDIYIVDEYTGEPLEFEENSSMWIRMDKIKEEQKVFASIRIIDYLKNNINLRINCESNDKIIEIEENYK